MEREEQQEQAFHILVVDDEPDLEPLIKQRMRPHIRSGKYRFLFAGDGNEAVDVLSEDDSVDMVVTDINMPGMDGLTLLGRIAAINPDIKSIVVSAYGDMGNIRTAMKPRRLRLRHQATRLQGLRGHDRAHPGAHSPVEGSPSVARQADRPAEPAGPGAQHAAGDPPGGLPERQGLRRPRQHGAGSECRWRLLRRREPGARTHRVGRGRRIGQGHPGSALHDVEPHPAEGCSHRRTRPGQESSPRSTTCSTRTIGTTCS